MSHDLNSSFLSPSQLSAKAKIALFEQKSPSKRRRNAFSMAVPMPAISQNDHNNNHRRTQSTSAIPPELSTDVEDHFTLQEDVTDTLSDAPTPRIKNNSSRPRRQPFSLLSPNLTPNANSSNKDLYKKCTAISNNGNDNAGDEDDDAQFLPDISSSRDRKHNSDTLPVIDMSQMHSDKVFYLEREIERLKVHIEILDSDTHRHELIELLEQKERELLAKDERHLVLKTKFQRIQQGLVAIENERQSLTKKALSLEKEKQTILAELEYREKEIASLSRRCSEQTEKVKESTLIRANNRELSIEVERLQSIIADNHHNESLINRIQQELDTCQKEKADLLERMRNIRRDHEAVAENLRTCLKNLEKLTEEKRVWEEERQRLLGRVELTREQQRLEHTQVRIELEQEIKGQNEKIEKLEKALRDKESDLRALEEHVAELVHEHDVAVEKIKAEQEVLIANLKEERETHITKLEEKENELKEVEAKRKQQVCETQAREQELTALRFELEGTDGVIQMLQAEVANSLDKLMEANTTLQQLEEDHKMVQALTADIEALETDRSELTETLHERDMQIAELSAEILKLEIEKELIDSKGKTSIDELQAKFELLEREKHVSGTEAKEKLEAAHARMRRLEEELEQSKREINQANNNIMTHADISSERLRRLESLLEQSSCEKEKVEMDAQQQINLANKRIFQLESELQQSQHRTEKASHEIQMLKRELELSQQNTSNAEASAKKQIDAANESLQSLASEIEHYKKLCQASDDRTLVLTTELSQSNVLSKNATVRVCSLENELRQTIKLQHESSEQSRALQIELERVKDQKQQSDDQLSFLGSALEKAELKREQDQQRRIALEAELEYAKSARQQAEVRAQFLESEFQQANTSQIESHAREVAELKAIVEQLQREAESSSSEIASQSKTISCLHSKLSDADDRIVLLEDGLLKAVEEKQECLNKMKLQASEENMVLKSDIESLKIASEEQLLSHEKALQAKDKIIASLKKGAQESEEHFAERHKSYLLEVAEVRQELNQTRTLLALKEDEIRDLQFIEIHDRDEEIAALGKEVNKLKHDLEAKQLEFDLAIQECEARVKYLSSRLGDQSDRDTSRIREHESRVAELQERVAMLKKENDNMTKTIESQNKRLGEQAAELKSVSQTLIQRENTVDEMKAECRKLRLWVEESQTEREKLVAALAQDGDQRITLEQTIEHTQQQNAKLQRDLSIAQDNLAELKDQIGELETVVKSRTNLLDDMLLHNKQLEARASDRDSRYAQLESERIDVQMRLEEQVFAFEQARAEWRHKEDRYMDDLNAERMRLEITENELVAVRRTLEVVEETTKDASSLQKENEELRDKVRRQEAYLRRKLEKDKLLKSRGATGIQIPKARPGSAPRPKRSAGSSSTRSMASLNDSCSLDAELELLLAD